jgi:hypothetical protein
VVLYLYKYFVILPNNLFTYSSTPFSLFHPSQKHLKLINTFLVIILSNLTRLLNKFSSSCQECAWLSKKELNSNIVFRNACPAPGARAPGSPRSTPANTSKIRSASRTQVHCQASVYTLADFLDKIHGPNIYKDVKP